MTNKRFEHLFEVQRAGLAVLQRHHVDAEHVLQLRLGEQIIDDHFAGLTALDLNHHAQAIFIRLIAQLSNAFDFLLFNQLGDLLNQPGLVHLIRQLSDDNVIAAGFIVVLDGMARAHVNTSTASAVSIENARTPVDDPPGGEIRTGDVLHQIIHRERVVVDERQATVDHFPHVVRRDVRRHAHRDARRPVDQQVGNFRRQHVWDSFSAVVVIDPIDRVFFEIRQQLVG